MAKVVPAKPQKFEARSPEAFSRFAAAYWYGHAPLASAFWLYGILVGGALNVAMANVSAVVFNHLQLAAMVDDPVVWLFFGYVTAGMMASWLTYAVWNAVSIWRCAARADGVLTLAGLAARVFVVVFHATFWPAFAYVTAAGL